jgi:adenine specific DNA methylase mod
LFFPVYVDVNKHAIHSIGEPLDVETDRETVSAPDGCVVVWPIKTNGVEGRWRCSPEYLRELVDKGCARVGEYDKANDRYSILYLSKATMKRIESDEIEVLGKDGQGSLMLGRAPEKEQLFSVKTVWNRNLHRAGEFGTRYIRNLLPGRTFPYPKSLYAVMDSLKIIVDQKPNAIILDFFSGSGTTLHAVNLLNAKDGGQRRCIMVTNNEVSESEAKDLAAKGYQPGDEEWNKLGIARYVTWPRTVCSIEGHDINGNPLKGNYLGSERSMADGFKANAAFFQLGFLDKTAVALGMQFKEMLPLLWMKAGAIGPCPSLKGQDIPDMLILPENKFAVLVNENVFASFEQRLEEHPEIQTVYLITDYEVNYRSMKKSLNVETTYQLYRDYLDNFRINRERN